MLEVLEAQLIALKQQVDSALQILQLLKEQAPAEPAPPEEVAEQLRQRIRTFGDTVTP
jgi:hypothetical protein